MENENKNAIDVPVIVGVGKEITQNPDKSTEA